MITGRVPCGEMRGGKNMNIGRRLALRFFLPLLAALAAAVVLKEAVAPGIVRRRLISAVRENCENCELSLGRVRVSLFPPALSGRGVRFTGGKPDATVVNAEAERAFMPFSLFSLLRGRFRAGRIEIERPAVTVTEGDMGKSSPPGSGEARPPDFEIEGVEVRKGSFTYVREHPGRRGILSVSRINAVLGPLGGSKRFRDSVVEGSADGMLEGTGLFHLEVGARIFSRLPDVDVKLRLTGQELSGLNRFFKPNDGIELKGSLIEGSASAAVRGSRLDSYAHIRYRGFGVKIKKTGKRGAFSAFFQNLMASVMMGKQNVDGGKYDRSGTANLERKPKESLISFILRGMKEAAMKISSQGGK
ncbi:MAG: hypothetical protein COT18_11090 [Elusimicrobia bacterium CG08_land_8_20_14_0_20_59_10]|nr:MAG: hypothetical protein COT18_11090 [Elusimicrobia bacterium CG08_land_8_20_14_0_20_59_10]